MVDIMYILTTNACFSHLDLLICGNEGLIKKARTSFVNLLILHIDQFNWLLILLLLKVFHLDK